MQREKSNGKCLRPRRFLKGEINKDEYGRYINSLYFVYK